MLFICVAGHTKNQSKLCQMVKPEKSYMQPNDINLRLADFKCEQLFQYLNDSLRLLNK